ncbi:Transcriptional corepressor SEUSS [Vitis vinifera]|uniref:Transcriptional corepressor SEUSS n=1 Tax=Vitis vinifera TaxID=29760 RepID=A0A438HKU0_VITVI|nr:Transcriptional corepressor SEUSS [Vitis vinifera]
MYVLAYRLVPRLLINAGDYDEYDTAEERAKQHGDILRDLVKNSPKSNRKEGKKNPRNFVLLLNANQQQSEEQLHVFPNFDQFFCLRSKSLEFLKTFSVQLQLWHKASPFLWCTTRTLEFLALILGVKCLMDEGNVRLLFWKDGAIRATHSYRWSPTCSPFTFAFEFWYVRSSGGSCATPNRVPSLVSPRTQYNNMNLLGNVPSVSSLLSQSFGNGGSNPGLSGPGSGQRGGIDAGAESDPLSGVGNGLGFTPPASFVPTNMANPGSAAWPTAIAQFSAPLNTQQQQQYQSIRGGLGGVGPVKLEPQVTNDQHGQQQQLQSLRNIGPVKLEPQQIPTMRSLAPVKMEPQHSDQSLFLHQQQQQQQQHQQQQHQQQQQQFLHMSRQSSAGYCCAD